MSTVASVVKKPHRAKKSKKDRKHGRGVRKVEKSRFKSYAGLFAVSRERKLQRMKTREARLARRREKKLLSVAGGTGIRASLRN